MKNRCVGCQYYDGFKGEIVICSKGYKNIFKEIGCDEFEPDITASCSDCYYKEYDYFRPGENKIHKDVPLSVSYICQIHGPLNSSRDYCPDYARKEDNSSNKKKKGCFVTTTICDLLGKNDNCIELNTLRQFRDNILMKNEKFKRLVESYYSISDEIVYILLNKTDNKNYAKNLMNTYVYEIIDYINSSKVDEAIELYVKMLKQIKKDREWDTIQQ